MRTRINNITFTPDTRSINTGITDLTIDDIRLFINESQMKVICSSMQKDNIVSINSGVVTYKDTFPVLAVGDHITFEIDKGDDVAKEANATANKQAVLSAIEQAKIALQGNDQTATLAALKTAIAAIDISDLAKEATLNSVGLDAAAAKTAAQAITGYALQGSDSTKSITTLDADLGDVAAALEYMEQGGMPQIAQIAKQGTNANASLSEVQIQATNAASDALLAKTAAQAIVGYALQGSDSTATNTALEILLQSIITTMYKGVPIVSQSGDATISPNTWNVWSDQTLSSVTVTKGSDISGVLNVYNMRFLVGSNFQLIFSGFGSVLWVNGVAPTFVAGHIYEISIVESRGVWAEF